MFQVEEDRPHGGRYKASRWRGGNSIIKWVSMSQRGTRVLSGAYPFKSSATSDYTLTVIFEITIL